MQRVELLFVFGEHRLVEGFSFSKTSCLKREERAVEGILQGPPLLLGTF